VDRGRELPLNLTLPDGDAWAGEIDRLGRDRRQREKIDLEEGSSTPLLYWQSFGLFSGCCGALGPTRVWNETRMKRVQTPTPSKRNLPRPVRITLESACHVAAEFWSKAATKGHIQSRYNLGCIESQKGNHDHAVRHWLISAKMGNKDSVENIKRAFEAGIATKEQYTQVLREYQDAVEEMKSHDRDEAAKRTWIGRKMS
ncbi:hypothetical protein THAOC_01310, partial [Thalassiosira oceanica]